MAKEDNLVPFTGADDPRRGHKKKGSKHISTWIKEMLEDEEFEAILVNPKGGFIEFKGAPLKAIIETARFRAALGDVKWAEWLAKYGYGSTLKVEIDDPRKAILAKYGLGDAGQTKKT